MSYISVCDVQNTAFLSTLTDKPYGKTEMHVIGSVIYHYPVLDSTNACAGRLLSQIRPKPGTIIIAGFQTSGRGQINKGWHSAPGLNLCLSCIIYPDIRPQDQFQISAAVSLAVRDTVLALITHRNVTIKWPNDIYVNDKKIAGILIQNSIQGNKITNCVAGIGLNVNETEFPVELPNPTSLKLESTDTLYRDDPKTVDDSPIPDIKLDLKAVQERLIENLRLRLDISSSNVLQLHEDYQAALYRRNILSSFRLPQKDTIQSGTIEKVDDVGRLTIRWQNGHIVSYQHREIEYVL